jgi:hypothetical protein
LAAPDGRAQGIDVLVNLLNELSQIDLLRVMITMSQADTMTRWPNMTS